MLLRLQDKAWVHGPGHEPRKGYVVKADADTLTKQQGSTCFPNPTSRSPTRPLCNSDHQLGHRSDKNGSDN